MYTKILLIVIVTLIILHIIKYISPVCFPETCVMFNQPHYYMELYIFASVFVSCVGVEYFWPELK
jgi:hypothetical protein